MGSAQRLLVRNEVEAEKASDFEKLLTDKVIPAVEQARKDMAERWEAFRADDEEDRAVFVFLFEGGDIDAWELEPILSDALGAEEAKEVLGQFTGMLLEEQKVTELRPLG